MRFLVAAAVASSLASCSLAAANHCKLEGPSIGTFDLSPLRNKARASSLPPPSTPPRRVPPPTFGCSTCVLTPCRPTRSLARRTYADDYTATNPDGGAVSLNFCGPVSSDESPAEGASVRRACSTRPAELTLLRARTNAAAQNYGAYIEDSRGGISLG